MEKKPETVYVAGHEGLMGSALVRLLQQRGYQTITATRRELDLRDGAVVRQFFLEKRPAWVFLAAARVGGIQANSSRPVDFLLENLQIQNNVLEAAHGVGVERLLFPGSNCMYPRLAAQPLQEESLLTGPLEPTNQAYAVAKIAGMSLCQAYRQQYGARFLCVIPATLYGPNDNYRLAEAHVLPMLLRRFHEAKVAGLERVTVWGTGKPLREFLYVEDMAEAFLFLMAGGEVGASVVNIGGGEELSIAELAGMIRQVVGFGGEVAFDTGRPDGMPRKLLDSQRMLALGWRPRVGLREGLARTYKDFLANKKLRK